MWGTRKGYRSRLSLAGDHSRWSEGGASALTPEQNTRHLFVETNWLHEYAAPAHHKVRQPSHCLKRHNVATSFCTFPTCHLRRHTRRSRRSASLLTVPEFIGTFGGRTKMVN